MVGRREESIYCRPIACLLASSLALSHGTQRHIQYVYIAIAIELRRQCRLPRTLPDPE